MAQSNSLSTSSLNILSFLCFSWWMCRFLLACSVNLVIIYDFWLILYCSILCVCFFLPLCVCGSDSLKTQIEMPPTVTFNLRMELSACVFAFVHPYHKLNNWFEIVSGMFQACLFVFTMSLVYISVWISICVRVQVSQALNDHRRSHSDIQILESKHFTLLSKHPGNDCFTVHT